ncbi:hypothetical protein SCLCIDRAFT_20573 [Scleroderma citrinum Foug A]|uniref:Uncharacterized protein n=1 Tax=Scleroderma citrinum Foug A TaxID=1036808 RepID=A0A0C3A3E7_9AGAM|nr:hypothetical protein SCLCIDRAFT_20573 [Scleroderma citrinum Foug A]
MFYTTFIVLLAAINTIYVRADPTPTAPGPGAVFIEGQTCSTSWQVDPSGLWKTMVIDLMTGDNYNMVHLTTVGTVDGTDPSKTTFSYICPQVTPYSAIYFYQLSSPASGNSTWTTRFTITDSTSDVVPPPQSTQPGGASIPWGTGTLVGASTSSSNSTSTSSMPTSGASLASAPSITTSGLPSTDTGVTIFTVTTTPAAGSTTSSTPSANGAVGTVTTFTLVWQTIFTLGFSAFGLAVVF